MFNYFQVFLIRIHFKKYLLNYNEIDSRLKGYFPNALNQEQNDKPKEQRKPVQTVASAGRKQEGRRTVKLTASQVAIAKKLNVPLDEYAKYVKEDK